MSSTYGENLKLSIFGQSHGAAIGMTLDGIPAGLPVDTDALQIFLNRRAPGQNDWSTPRKEADRPELVRMMPAPRAFRQPMVASMSRLVSGQKRVVGASAKAAQISKRCA